MDHSNMTFSIQTAPAKINFRDDFVLRLKLLDNDNNPVEWPNCDFKIVFTTGENGWSYKQFVASCKSGVCHNCRLDYENTLLVIFDKHGLKAGRLWAELHTELPDSMFPDGFRHSVKPQPLPVELILGHGDGTDPINATLIAPYAVMTAYDMARSAGYGGTREDYVAQLVQLGDTAAMVSDFAAGKAKVADALTRRGYPTEADAPFDEMARTITGMSWGAGWSAATVALSETVKARLTDEEIAAITAKGCTIA